MSDPELPKEVARWVRYAKEDLKVAGLILEHGQVPRAACFNAQQCAEKSVKATLVFLQIPFPKGSFVAKIDADRQADLATEVDRYVYDEALSIFLVAPQALYAVDQHVNFVGHAATFELAETEVTGEHWSRRNGDTQSSQGGHRGPGPEKQRRNRVERGGGPGGRGGILVRTPRITLQLSGAQRGVELTSAPFALSR